MSDYYCQVRGTFNNSLQWSFGLNVTSNQATQALLTTWANAWAHAWTDSTYGLDTLYPTNTVLNEYVVSLVDANYRQTSKARQSVSVAGTSADDTLPYQEAIVVSLRTAQVGRHARGRFFLPAMGESAVNNDVLTPAAQTRVKSAVESVRQSIQADGSSFFIVHKPTINPPTVAGPKYVVTDFMVSNKPARQSRRTRKVIPTYA